MMLKTIRNCTIAAGMCLLSLYTSAQSPVNYIHTWEAKAPEKDGNAFITRTLQDVQQSTLYLDGLGRPLQTVIKQGAMVSGSAATDLVQPVEYDAFGREAKKYLPYASSANAGAYRPAALTEQTAFYNSTDAGKNPIAGQGETHFYGYTQFEASPLNRGQEKFAPGGSWAGTAGETDEADRRSIKTKYLVNTEDDEVRVWNVTEPPYQTFGTYSSPGEYNPGELYKTITIDEHNRQIIEFKDKQGQVILKKVQLKDSVSDDGSGSDHDDWICTYYIYDDFNRLRAVIQPEGVKAIQANSWVISGTVYAEQCFRYEYDKRGRMCLRRTPGVVELTQTVYDKRDRLAMVMNPSISYSMNGPSKWLVTIYDDLNRPVQTGLWDNNSYITYHIAQLESSPDFYYPFNESNIPAASWDMLTQTHYDDYQDIPLGLSATYLNDWDSYFAATDNNNFPYPQFPQQSNAVRNKITWTIYKVVDISSTDQYLYSANIYDENGRLIQVQQTNITGGVDVTTTQYTWSGLPLIIVEKQQIGGADNPQTTVVVTKMTYDELGRLIKLEKKLSNTLVPVNNVMGQMTDYTVVFENEYDALNRLKKKKLSPEFNSGMGLETLTYDYNIRGWLLGVNRDYARDANQSHYFGFDLGYDKINNNLINDQTYNEAHYNGNISGMVWKSKGDGEKRKYDLTYDAVNRLLKGDFTQYADGVFDQSAGVNYNVKMGDGADVQSAYDLNGNIKRMQQWGFGLQASSQIDDLSYEYLSGSNKLAKVTDLSASALTNLGDFKDGSNTGDDYTYNGAGSLLTDNNKGIFYTGYNHLGLPELVAVWNDASGSGGFIYYAFDALGNKLQKKVSNTAYNTIFATDKTTTYISGNVYESSVTYPPSAPSTVDYTCKLQFIAHEEGRIRVLYDDSASLHTPTGFTYDYFIKDHLGNVRIVLTEEPKQDVYPPATMETVQAATEEALYTNLPETRADKPSGYPADEEETGTNDKVAKVKADAGSQKIGPSITLKVMSGDRFNIRVSSWYSLNATTPDNPISPLTDLVAALISGVGGAAASTHGAGIASELQTSGVLIPQATDFINSQTYNSNKPKAYINWILFDEQFTYYDGDFEQVGDNEELKKHTKTNLSVGKNGYLYVYVSNETPNISVFFDNLRVTHDRGPILEETHYYPFGLTMVGISSKALNNAIENKYRFNGGNELQNKEFSDGSGLDWYDATFRGYDPQIGRFMQVDPLADWLANQSPYSFAYNNPILFNDPLGLTPDSTGRPLSTTPANAVVLEEIVITSRSVEKPKMYSDEGMASAQPQFIPALGTPSEPSSSNAGTLAVAATVLAANPEAYPVTVPVAVAAGTAVLTYYTIQALLSDPHGVGYSLPSPYAVRDNTNYQPRPVIAPPHLFASEKDRTAQDIISKDRKGSINSEFPDQYRGKTLGEIEKAAKQGQEGAKKALKLLKDGRFKK